MLTVLSPILLTVEEGAFSLELYGIVASKFIDAILASKFLEVVFWCWVSARCLKATKCNDCGFYL